jgi:hypothetical protein
MTQVRTIKRVNRRRAPAPQVKRRVAPPLHRKAAPRRRARMAPELKSLIWIVSAAMLTVGVLLYPFELCVVPAWSVLVVDENSHPVAGIAVQQEWGQFGAREMTWADSRLTGADGRVDFPERDVESPLGPRALKNFLTSGIQPVDGKEKLVPSAHLFVCRQGKTGEITWVRGMGQPERRLLVHKGFCQYSPPSLGT